MIIAIASGKGGVGKTTITLNLAAALQLLGKAVCVVDAAITTSSLGLHLGITRYTLNLPYVLRQGIPLQSAVFGHGSGLQVIPGSVALQTDERIAEQLKGQMAGLRGYDFVLLDCAPGLGLESRSALLAADELLIVTAPDLPAVTDTMRLVRLAGDFGLKITGIVLNRVSHRAFEVTEAEIETATGVPVIAAVPEDLAIPRSIALHTPAVLLAPRSPAARALRALATKLCGIPARRTWLERLAALLGK